MTFKTDFSRIISTSFCILLAFVPKIYGQDEKNNCKKPLILTRTFENNHYAPRALDDSLSEDIFYRFFTLSDPDGLIFTTDDVESLSGYKYRLDDLIKSESCEFLDLFVRKYIQRLEEDDSLISLILSKPLDYNKQDSITFNMSMTSRQFPALNEKFLLWQKWLKYQVINRLIISAMADSSSLDWNFIVKKESLGRQIVLKKEKTETENLIKSLKDNNSFISEMFLNAIATSYDPHSEFFSESGKKSFEASLSKEKRSFGIVLEENLYGEIVISKLVPGGPAWKSNELHKGDVMLKIKTKNGKIIDFLTGDTDNSMEVLSSETPEYIYLTIRKTDGTVKTLKLNSEIIKNEENNVSSYILKGNKTVGYISLPDFYTDFSQGNGLGCANDVAKEILNLKKEQMQGLILDLRDNGGGSIEEAIELAGIFINEGPLILIKSNQGKIKILKDVNRGTVYDGPLIILVNQSTASASEIVVSALHDYNRALIVGSQTFGKATGQLIIPMDSGIHVTSGLFNSRETNDFVKVTVEKIFPLSGVSYQKKGIQPDIVLPAEANYTDESENDFNNALEPETIIKKIQFTPLNPMPVAQIKKYFDEVPLIQETKKSSPGKELIIAKDHQYMKLIIDPEKLIRFYKNFNNSTTLENDSLISNYQVLNTRSDAFILKMDKDTRFGDDQIKSEIIKDKELQDTYRIMDQLINLSK
jgi:carboxyl-terminal processing protease